MASICLYNEFNLSQESDAVAAKKRTIFFYEPIIKDKDDNLKNLPSDFWDELWKVVDAMPNSTFEFRHYAIDYLIQAGQSVSPSARYLYFGKARSQEDWPDIHDQARIWRLSESGIPGNLVESAYLMPAGINLVVAIAKTSGGPTASSIEAGINGILKGMQTGDEFTLAAYVRNDQFARLNRSVGVSRMQIKLAKDTNVEDVQSKGNQLGEALVRAKSLDPEDAVTVELTVSFGNAKASLPRMNAIGDAFKELVGTKEKVDFFDKVQATVISSSSEGKFERDQIDLISDRVTIKSTFSTTSDEQPRPEQVVGALMEASEKLRNTIAKTN